MQQFKITYRIVPYQCILQQTTHTKKEFDQEIENEHNIHLTLSIFVVLDILKGNGTNLVSC